MRRPAERTPSPDGELIHRFECGCEHRMCPCEEADCPYGGVTCDLCPTHAAAPQLLQALEALIAAAEDDHECVFCDNYSNISQIHDKDCTVRLAIEAKVEAGV